jgi:hypothetical protein
MTGKHALDVGFRRHGPIRVGGGSAGRRRRGFRGQAAGQRAESAGADAMARVPLMVALPSTVLPS